VLATLAALAAARPQIIFPGEAPVIQPVQFVDGDTEDLVVPVQAVALAEGTDVNDLLSATYSYGGYGGGWGGGGWGGGGYYGGGNRYHGGYHRPYYGGYHNRRPYYGGHYGHRRSESSFAFNVKS
jgi:hypothetical protein